jgi:hypothetical protein
MFGLYIEGEDVMDQILRRFPNLDTMYPFVWTYSTLQEVTMELDKLGDGLAPRQGDGSCEKASLHEAFETRLQAKCVMPDGFVATIFAPDIYCTTFQILHHDEIALHVEVRGARDDTVDKAFDGWRLGLMTFKTTVDEAFDDWAEGIGFCAKRGDVTTLFMCSQRNKRSDYCDYDAIDMHNLYQNKRVEDTWGEDVGPIWHVSNHDEILDLDFVRVVARRIQRTYQRSWYRVDQRKRRAAIDMGLHDRLGKDSWLYRLEPEHIRRITELAER